MHSQVEQSSSYNNFTWSEMNILDYTPDDRFLKHTIFDVPVTCYLRSKLPSEETIKCCYYKDTHKILG